MVLALLYALITVLVSSIVGMPLDSTSGTSEITTVADNILAAHANHCDDSSFEDRTTSRSPLIEDCYHLAANIAGGGEWSQFGGFHRTLARYKTCRFGVIGRSSYYVGNEDIRDLIYDSARRFGREEGGQWRMQARGFMFCRITPKQDVLINVEWGIF